MKALKRVRIRKTEDGMPLEFVREVESLQRVMHPNVVRLEQIFVGKTHINLVFPYYECDLLQIVEGRREPFGEDTLREIMRQILEGLHALHSVGLVHRDIKPSNVLVNNNKLVLTDFG